MLAQASIYLPSIVAAAAGARSAGDADKSLILLTIVLCDFAPEILLFDGSIIAPKGLQRVLPHVQVA
jgi:hypothetical protein